MATGVLAIGSGMFLFALILALVPVAAWADLPKSWDELTVLGKSEQTSGNMKAAESAFRSALAVAENGVERDWRIGASLAHLASNLARQGRYQESLEAYRRALQSWNGVLNPGHENFILAGSGLGEVYGLLGQYKNAERYLKRAVAYWDKAGPERPREQAVARNNLAVLYQRAHRPQLALALYLEALRIFDLLYGPAHPATSGVHHNLGDLYREMRDFKRAEKHLLQALELREREAGAGAGALDVAMTLNNLGVAYHEGGKSAQGAESLSRALAMRERMLPAEHPQIAITLNNLGHLLADERQYAESESHLRRALGVAERALGPEHPTVAEILCNLVVTLRGNGKPKEAREHQERAERILRARAAEDPFQHTVDAIELRAHP